MGLAMRGSPACASGQGVRGTREGKGQPGSKAAPGFVCHLGPQRARASAPGTVKSHRVDTLTLLKGSSQPDATSFSTCSFTWEIDKVIKTPRPAILGSILSAGFSNRG